jgi:hypothetical protein
MRIALIVVVGFVAVFLWTLVAAQGSEGPSLTTAHFCGSWRPSGQAPRRHVVYATRMSCGQALMLAADYNRKRTCPRTSMSCLAHIHGFKCFTKGTAGRHLIWIGCERPSGRPPRSTFSVDRY